MKDTHPRVLLSLTSIPRRFDNALREVVAKITESGEPAVVCLPRHYRKWGEAPAPDYLQTNANVVLFRPSRDYGPATKLLGAIEYIHSTGEKFDGIVTLDDDLYYDDTTAAIRYLKQQAHRRPGCVITIGGMKLEHHPFRCKNGAYGNNVGYVDAVIGFRGVYYPVDKIAHDRRLFDFAAEMPEGIFNEDDAYFGICLGRLGIPIYAVKPPRTVCGRLALKLIDASGAGDSAVQEKTPLHRIENEMQIFQFAVSRGWLPNPMTVQYPDPPLRKLLNRTSIGRKVMRWTFNR